MLESSDIDDDFFTPSSSTNLANIFSEATPSVEKPSENSSLKYVPPKAKPSMLPEELQDAECNYICTLQGYEWFKNNYTLIGQVGFTIMKMQSINKILIMIYDLHKTSLSFTTISESLEVTITDNTFLSYYDDDKKYWSLFGTLDNIAKAIDELRKYNVKFITESSATNNPPNPRKTDIFKIQENINSNNTEKESDTDSHINRKIKASVLSRISSMGHSVLPVQCFVSSDSSDTDDVDQLTRHKTAKNNPRRTIHKVDKHGLLSTQNSLVKLSNEVPNIDSQSTKIEESVGNQLAIPKNSTVLEHSSSNVSMIASEHSLSDTKLRLGIVHITDKVDQIFNKVSDLKENANTNFQTEVFQKLLNEYESKIKTYENILQMNGIPNVLTERTMLLQKEDSNNVNIYKNRIEQLEKMNRIKEQEAKLIQNELETLKSKKPFENASTTMSSESEEILKLKDNNKILQIQLEDVQTKLALKHEELNKLTDEYQIKCQVINELKNTKDSMLSSDAEEKIKLIMNETYQYVSINFNEEESYSGSTIKNIVGKIIKKVTLNFLSNK